MQNIKIIGKMASGMEYAKEGFQNEQIAFDSRGFLWWSYFDETGHHERCLGRNRTKEEMQDLLLWARRRHIVLPPELAKDWKLPAYDKEWGWIV